MTRTGDHVATVVRPGSPNGSGLPGPGLQAADVEVVRAVDAHLAEYLAQRRAEAVAVDDHFTVELVDPLISFVREGGKRLRPLFAWWGWRAAGGADAGAEADAVLRAVSAVELVHACALVHDDVMDDSAIRRGKPAVHVAMAARHRAAGMRGDDVGFGRSMAILVGDLALCWADDMMHTSGASQAMLHRAGSAWRAMRTEMMAGQFLDLRAQATGTESIESALRVNLLKTAGYTVAQPLLLGALLGGASSELSAALHAYGVDLGTAFQLRDDFLGVFGEPEITGKPAGDDIREGKHTVLVNEALRLTELHGRPDEAATLRGALGDPLLSPQTLAEVRRVLVDSGAVAVVEQRIETLAISAVDRLSGVDLSESTAARLRTLADAMIRRDV
ncbi:polyprenyl synthetase family protein [Actinoalloteichus hymeniacidonis]|uniref:Geranylgeranyl pyrophosphate synthase n=1 Tax=Actinoalloteichus hymeniacidonis TaxID=340345 RepID=A0AAC9MXW3_9PSEU|nr:polyprenyl synthetase family protein [Actinoalloteichus hymeniacidonis]AOS62789.1 geranylgeranyl pyrophosphate synthase [Actinoalloteichus hymeniacidonis]MBB5909180.1 geranylgeranyl diphosphate synthase type I [Actinoalloteichus hymeniacidonis]